MAGVPPVPPSLNDDEKMAAMLAHLLAFLGYVLVLGQYIAPLVIYVMYKDKSRFVAFHALQSLYFQLTLLVLGIVGGLLVLFTCGLGALIVIPAAMVVVFGSAVLMIIAAIKAYGGEIYEYWLVGRWARDQVGI